MKNKHTTKKSITKQPPAGTTPRGGPPETSSAKKQLEDLFRGVKRPKPAVVEDKTSDEVTKAPPKRGSADDLFGTGAVNTRTTARKVTEEGWPVYTVEEIGLANTGGDTKDCPFDCSCCY